jgi:hypothetical protein
MAVTASDTMLSQKVAIRFSSSMNRSVIMTTQIRPRRVISGAAAM